MTQEQIATFARELEAWADQIARDINALTLQARMIQRSTEPPLPEGPEINE